MTIALEQLADGSISDRNFQRLATLVLDTGGKTVGIRFGTNSTVDFAASKDSSVATVTHGLGKTPVAAFCQFHDTGSLTISPVANIGGLTSTQLSVAGHNDTAITATDVPFFWVVIG